MFQFKICLVSEPYPLTHGSFSCSGSSASQTGISHDSAWVAYMEEINVQYSGADFPSFSALFASNSSSDQLLWQQLVDGGGVCDNGIAEQVSQRPSA